MDQGKDKKIKDAPMWMWAIAFFGLALVVSSIAFMVYEAAAGDSSHADITVQVDTTLPTSNGYLVKFRAVNQGGSTVEGLTVEGVLRNGPDVIETSDTVLEWVPAHSEREGGLFFTSDPRQLQLQLRAKGYENP
ncbi:MAG TPA: hypothetical protein VIT88_03915 [Pyrinomonadaceae bacterium]